MSEIGSGAEAAIGPPSVSLETIPDSAFKQGAGRSRAIEWRS